jgi:uncharacterized SAM-binding protein YcdF (DUF218 family)
MQALAQLFIKIWQVDALPTAEFKPDVIVSLSYAVKRDALTNGTRESLKSAMEYWKKFPSALLVFANTSHSFPGSEKTEEKFKFEIIEQAKIPRSSVISCEPIVNTVTEAETICRTLQQIEKPPKNILLVTGLLHSRGASYIWRKTLKKYFPEAKFAIAAIPPEFEYQKGHPLFFQRGPILWIIGNLLRQIALRCFGLTLTGKLYDPSRPFY